MHFLCKKCYKEDDGEPALSMKTPIQQAAAAMGRVKSDKKAAAARENGKRGGRPPTPKPTLICPKCKSSNQVWNNQITGKPKCHRVGCEENSTPAPEPINPKS